MVEEHVLAERLIRYDTSREDELRASAGFVRGWLESRDIEVAEHEVGGLPVLVADVGAPESDAPCVVFHGHLDVVPAAVEQFEPRVDGDRLYGRGAYDMKGGLAVMMCALKDAAAQRRTKVRFVCVPDEESGNLTNRASDAVVDWGLGGDFAITGEPTDLQIGIEAKGVLVMRITVSGRAAHSSRPWLGDNAVTKAIDTFRAIERLPFGRQSSAMFERPSINVGRIEGGDVFNKVPDVCTMVVDVRFLPGQDPQDILAQVRSLPDVEAEATYLHPTVSVEPDSPFIRALREALGRHRGDGEAPSVGRDGASDAASFVRAGIPAVEFGPVGGGHHGPDEWVSLSGLTRYRAALGDFIRLLPVTLGRVTPLHGELAS